METVPTSSEPIASESLEVTESTEATETVVIVDYTPVIMDATSSLANIILCGALMIVGVLCAFQFWEVKLR